MRSMGILLKFESAIILISLTILYFWFGFGIWLFVLAFFAPDLSFAAYLLGPKIGSRVYNSVHSYALAAIFAVIGCVFAMPLLVALALILGAHIGFDRMLGYGLKHESAFTDTHLGQIGKRNS